MALLRVRTGPGLAATTPAAIVALCAAALLTSLMLAQLPARPRIWAVATDFGHAPVFGALALMLLSLFRSFSGGRHVWVVWLAFAASISLGIAVECAQSMIGRDSSWNDIKMDALGAACALGLAVAIPRLGFLPEEGPGIRKSALAAAIVSAGAAVYPLAEASAAYALRAMRFPVIAQFSSPLDLYFGEPLSARVSQVSQASFRSMGGSGTALRIESDGGTLQGWGHLEPMPDWSSFDLLRLDLTNPNERPLVLAIRVHDEAHDNRVDDRFNYAVTLHPGERRVASIPLLDVQNGPRSRLLDLRHVAGIIVFAPNPLPGQQFLVQRIWLE